MTHFPLCFPSSSAKVNKRLRVFIEWRCVHAHRFLSRISTPKTNMNCRFGTARCTYIADVCTFLPVWLGNTFYRFILQGPKKQQYPRGKSTCSPSPLALSAHIYFPTTKTILECGRNGLRWVKKDNVDLWQFNDWFHRSHLPFHLITHAPLSSSSKIRSATTALPAAHPTRLNCKYKLNINLMENCLIKL